MSCSPLRSNMDAQLRPLRLQSCRSAMGPNMGTARTFARTDKSDLTAWSTTFEQASPRSWYSTRILQNHRLQKKELHCKRKLLECPSKGVSNLSSQRKLSPSQTNLSPRATLSLPLPQLGLPTAEVRPGGAGQPVGVPKDKETVLLDSADGIHYTIGSCGWHHLNLAVLTVMVFATLAARWPHIAQEPARRCLNSIHQAGPR